LQPSYVSSLVVVKEAIVTVDVIMVVAVVVIVVVVVMSFSQYSYPVVTQYTHTIQASTWMT